MYVDQVKNYDDVYRKVKKGIHKEEILFYFQFNKSCK